MGDVVRSPRGHRGMAVRNGAGLAFGVVGALAAAAASRRGSRADVVTLGQRRVRRDRPSHRFYVVLKAPRSDPAILAGFRSWGAAESERRRMEERWGVLALVVDRETLKQKGADPEVGRWWAVGEPLDPNQEWSSALEAARAAIHNAYWLWAYRPYPQLEETVFLETGGSGDCKVAVWRERGLPADPAFWQRADLELERVGLALYHDAINAGYYVLCNKRPGVTWLPGRGPRGARGSRTRYGIRFWMPSLVELRAMGLPFRAPYRAELSGLLDGLPLARVRPMIRWVRPRWLRSSQAYLNPEQVEEMAHEVRSVLEQGGRWPASMPPVWAWEDGTLIDGHHRTKAALMAGADWIPAHVFNAQTVALLHERLDIPVPEVADLLGGLTGVGDWTMPAVP